MASSVEWSWRGLKQYLELLLICQRRELRIIAHLLFCLLGLPLIRVAERSTFQTGARRRTAAEGRPPRLGAVSALEASGRMMTPV